ncbi:LysR family transcriptional regulator [Pseudogemmobacter bohemicus]|uniref:LysR family transcriptional regulator n=1 Tax=Pseudogemmobacter bohemicus TaxID=2250708 RepID=UPI0018E4E58B|nr:LysR family transcriptional regulator [Pseudogemmobacter bohemicus]
MSINSLQLRHIRSFLAVAERRSFVDAAQQLGVSQPALSQTINHFEQVLGVKLFARTTRNVELTEHGQRLLKKSGDLDQEIKRYFAELKALRDSVGSKIRVGYLIGTGVQIIPEALRRFEEKFPDVTLELAEFDFNRPDGGLRDGEVDCAIVRPPIGVEGLHLDTLIEEPRIVCLPERHPLARHESLTIADIKDMPVVGAPGDGVWRDYWLASDLLDGQRLNVVVEAATLDSELQAVASHKGISITAESTAKYYARPGVTFRPLTDMSNCIVAIGYRKEGNPRVQDFVKIVKAVSADL